MKLNILLLSSAILAFSACNKDKSKECHYYNKPYPVNVSFVGYADYEISNFDVYQYEKNTNFTSLIKTDAIRNNELVPVENDTTASLFTLNNKADYVLVLPFVHDTFYIQNINYKEEYFSVIEPSGKCDQQKTYSQLPDSAKVNDDFVVFEKLDLQTATLYLHK